MFTRCFVVALLLGVGCVTWPLKQINTWSKSDGMLKHLYNSTQVLVDLSFFLYWQYLLKQFLSNWFLKFHLCTKYAVSALLCHKGTGKSKASILRFSFYCYVRKYCMGYEKNAMNIYLEIQKLLLKAMKHCRQDISSCS